MKQRGNIIDKLEKKWGKYAIINLMKYMVVLYIIGLVMSFVNPVIFNEMLVLDFDKIFAGQVWRLVTFAIAPPMQFGAGLDLIFALIALYMYYFIGSTLEQIWGAFKFNLFYFGGLFACILCALVAKILFGGAYGAIVTTDYVFLSMFLAYAMLMPNQEFLIYFILPVKAKWLGIIDVALIAFYAFQSVSNILAGEFVEGNIVYLLNIVFSMANLLILFFAFKGSNGITHAQKRKTKEYKKKINTLSKNRVHTCTTCGITSKTNPDMEFRFCSRCDGNREYCTEHLFTHEHISRIVINIDKDKK